MASKYTYVQSMIQKSANASFPCHIFVSYLKRQRQYLRKLQNSNVSQQCRSLGRQDFKEKTLSMQKLKYVTPICPKTKPAEPQCKVPVLSNPSRPWYPKVTPVLFTLPHLPSLMITNCAPNSQLIPYPPPQ
ncbi:hypothetical protein KIL84_018932 [Mauremys mutica]|uniref:Uncharacterized protein n=1 Tax=Mauremys mutica TaxID=74926 RepID=A0A9D3XU69_9SAUR|nr:hypothetical protein KIL84_018932 [Mauremys mutica]